MKIEANVITLTLADIRKQEELGLSSQFLENQQELRPLTFDTKSIDWYQDATDTNGSKATLVCLNGIPITILLPYEVIDYLMTMTLWQKIKAWFLHNIKGGKYRFTEIEIEGVEENK